MPTTITVMTTVNASLDNVWKCWTDPAHIMQWNNASDDWHTPAATNDLREGGSFCSTMAAKDGSFSFDFTGIYTKLIAHELIEYTIADGRNVSVTFKQTTEGVVVTEIFEAENVHPAERQQQGWQAILDNFKKHTEAIAQKQRLQFSATIKAPVSKVYEKMIAADSYREWTSAFNSTSQFTGSWNKGEKILFTGVDEAGKTGGMVAYIKDNRTAEYICIMHLGIVKDGEEIMSGPEVALWTGATECYTFRQEGDATVLMIEMDSNKDFEQYFLETWPLALNKLKQICEQ